MKSLYKYLLFSASVLALASCQTKEIMSVDAVQISANIESGLLTRVSEDGRSFTDGDAIKVVNTSRSSGNESIYRYSSSTGGWTADNIVLWEGGGVNNFHAWYPESASYEKFVILSDQSEKIASCDWMTASTAAKREDGEVNLLFSHHLSKVTVEVKEWKTEYEDNEKVIDELYLKSLSTELLNDGTEINGDGRDKYVTTAVLAANQKFAAIVAPGTYAAGNEIIRLNVGEKLLAVKTAGDITLEPSHAYKFSLVIGKDIVALDENGISVGEWSDGDDLGSVEMNDGVLDLSPDALTEYRMTFEGGDISIPLNVNVDYSVNVDYGNGDAGWIEVNESLSTQNTLVVTVKGNSAVSDRSSTLSIFNETMGTSIDIPFHQQGFAGYDDTAFDKNKYMEYAKNYYSTSSGGVFDADIEVYCSYIPVTCDVVKVWEFKFKLASVPSTYGEVCLASEYVGRDNTDEYVFTASGFGYNGVTWYDWAEMGVNATDIMTIKLDMQANLMWVNGKQLSLNRSMKIEYLFSSYYYDSDDGRYTCYSGFQEGARMYYVKGWDATGRLFYLGGASMETTVAGNREACWSAKYYNSSQEKFVSAKSFSYKGGTDTDPYGSGNLL